MTAENLVKETVWQDKSKYDEAERIYYENLNKLPEFCGSTPRSSETQPKKPNNPKSVKPEPNPPAPNNTNTNSAKEKKSKKKEANKKNKQEKVSSISSQTQSKSLAEEIAKAREHIKVSLENVEQIPDSNVSSDVNQAVKQLQSDYKKLKSDIDNIASLLQRFELRVKNLENSSQTKAPAAPSKPAPAPAKAKAPEPEEDDDDVDLFGSGSEDDDEEAQKVKEQRLAEYAAKKSKKPALIAKSMIIFDVKPWDDETDMKQMEVEVRKVTMDGLLWGTAKLVPVGYGINKLQIASVVEDEKVSVDDVVDKLQEIEELVQSVDIAAFNKI